MFFLFVPCMIGVNTCTEVYLFPSRFWCIRRYRFLHISIEMLPVFLSEVGVIDFRV
jgi:hypothetical protein